MKGEIIGAGGAFVAGILSFFSPCIFPLLPAYLAQLSGSASSQKPNSKRGISAVAVKNAAGFVIGFSITFIVLGLSASALGVLLLRYQGIIKKVGGIIVILLGLQLMGAIRVNFLLRDTRKHAGMSNLNFLKSVLLGLIFSAGWTPCIGPVLSSILVLAGSSGSMALGALLLGSYSLGLGVPFLVAAFFIGNILEHVRRINPYLPYLNKVAGILLIVLGILLFTGTFSELSRILS